MTPSSGQLKETGDSVGLPTRLWPSSEGKSSVTNRQWDEVAAGMKGISMSLVLGKLSTK